MLDFSPFLFIFLFKTVPPSLSDEKKSPPPHVRVFIQSLTLSFFLEFKISVAIFDTSIAQRGKRFIKQIKMISMRICQKNLWEGPRIFL